MSPSESTVSAPIHDHARPPRAAVLLVNLGTPDAPTTPAVRRYLAEFLADPRVIEAPRWLWRLVLHGVILRIRPARSAANYARIWTPQGSPLLLHSQALAAALDARLKQTHAGAVDVHLAMRYGRPNLRDVVPELARSGVRRLLLLPLYPQYSATSTGTVIDAIGDAYKQLRWPPELRIVNDYAKAPGYIEALARSVEAHWQEHGQADRLFLSFHGIPRRYFAAGDPYFCHCQATARALRERLRLPEERLVVAFQSRVGREEWLRPYTDETLRALPSTGVRSVQVLCPGFAVDCLETLEEMALANRDVFLAAGGERYEYVPALNASADHVDALAALVAQHTQGWSEFALDGSAAQAAESAALTLSRYERMRDGAR